jgi:folate-binding protein YgfZ
MIFQYRPTSPVQWNWTPLAGPDARDFLHRVTTVNVRDLSPGEGAPGFFLSAQGRVRAWFRLWCYGQDEFAFEYDAGPDGRWKRELLAAIDQYTFAERMQLTDLGDQLECRWLLTEDEADLAGLPVRPGMTHALEDEIRVCHQGSVDFGRAWVTAWGRPARLGQWVEQAFPQAGTATFAELERWRIEALRPRVGIEVTDATLPLEVGLKDGIAENKGCYPGQEVIEKIAALGSPPRRLARIEGQGLAPTAGAKVLNLAEPPAEVGEVTSVLPREGGFVALGILKKIHAKEGLAVRFSDSPAQASVTRVAPYA